MFQTNAGKFVCITKTSEYLCYEILNCITYTVHAREECTYIMDMDPCMLLPHFILFPEKKKSSFKNIIFVRSLLSDA